MSDAMQPVDDPVDQDSNFPPPGPPNYVTDGYPHRETDPRNWPSPDEHRSQSGGAGQRNAQNGAVPEAGQRASSSWLKALFRWRR